MISRDKDHLIQDAFFIVCAIYFAIFINDKGYVDALIQHFGEFKYLAIFISGIFFTSAFTTPTSIAFLSHLAQDTNLATLAFTGALGAVCGDYIIFKFIKDRVVEDLNLLFKFSKIKRLPLIFRTRLFKYFIPFVGALIISSPLPDELGLTLLGLSKIKDRYFFPISIVMNFLGILAIGFISKNLL
jgi:hypothetical protein